MVLKYEDIIPENPDPGITRRILARGGSLMGVEATFKKGAVGSVHKHPHEQVSYIGRFCDPGYFYAPAGGFCFGCEKGEIV